MERSLKPYIEKDLKKKMVLLGGPRQVGKTTLALGLLSEADHEQAYINFDDPIGKERFLSGRIPKSQSRIVFDEVHKHKDWRNRIKGYFDVHRKNVQFLITGSASLDFYRRSGDSLLGRVYSYRLHPLSLFEISNEPTAEILNRLMNFGGFPENFFSESEVDLKRWQKKRIDHLIRDDVLYLERVLEIERLESLALGLKNKVGSILSINSLREDLKVSHESVSKWLSILENVFFSFRIAPYGDDHLKLVHKEKKLYLWDWSVLEDFGSKFENLVASNLLKFCHFQEDAFGEDYELRFVRNKEKKEIDFLVLKKSKPFFAVECKTGERNLSKNLLYFKEKMDIPKIYQVHLGTEHFEEKGIEVLPFVEFSKKVLKI